MKVLRTHWLAALAAVVLLCGCGGIDTPNVEYVEGVVTLDSKPIEGVTVGFSPVKAGSGTPATGMTDANGVFNLTATGGGGPGEGTTVGEYNVSFFKIATSDSSQSLEAEHAAAEKAAENQTGLSEAPTSKNELPEAYKNPATSGVTVTVKSGKNTGDDFKFDLKSNFAPAGK